MLCFDTVVGVAQQAQQKSATTAKSSAAQAAAARSPGAKQAKQAPGSSAAGTQSNDLFGDSSGGDGVLAPVLARAAAAAGCDGIFIETHYDPSQALSDGPNQIPLRDLGALLGKLKQIHEISQ